MSDNVCLKSNQFQMLQRQTTRPIFESFLYEYFSHQMSLNHKRGISDLFRELCTPKKTNDIPAAWKLSCVSNMQCQSNSWI